MDAADFRSSTEPANDAPDEGTPVASARRGDRATRRGNTSRLPTLVSELRSELPVTDNEIRLVLAVLGASIQAFLDPERDPCMTSQSSADA